MNDKKIVIGAVFFTIVILGAGVFLLSKDATSVKIGPSQNAKASTNNKSYNWGKINYSGGPVSKTFNIKNIGTDSLKLTNIKTSCTCTKAQVTINGEKSPYFSMHSKSSWVGEVPKGGEAILTVIFDPAFHGPSGVGPISRLVSLETNDPNTSILEYTLTGNVVK